MARIAASAGMGRMRSALCRKTRAAISVAAETRPAACETPPVDRLIAVRESETLIGNEPKSPGAMLAAPRPISSWFASTSSPVREPKLRAATMPAPKLTRKIAAEPSMILSSGIWWSAGSEKLGKPLGMSPTTAMPRP